MHLRIVILLTTSLIQILICENINFTPFTPDQQNLMFQVKCASKAIASLIDSLSDQYSMRFHVKGMQSNVIVKYLQQKIGQYSKSPIVLYDLKKNETIQPGISQIILAKSLTDVQFITSFHFIENFPKGKLVNTYQKELVLVYSYNNDKLDKKFFKKVNFSNKRIWNSLSFLSYDKRGTRLLYSSLDQCSRNFSVSNEFNLKTLRWKTTNFFRTLNPSKKCILPAYIGQLQDYDDHDVICFRQLDTEGFVKFGGMYGLIVQVFAEMNNIKFQEEDIFNFADLALFPSELTTGTHDDYFTLHRTFPLNFRHSHFYVTKGSFYTQYEKLILPFDELTWILTISSFLIGFLTICVLHYFPIKTQSFIFGFKNHQPSLNLIQIFFGVGLIRLPGRNFARFLFMAFTLFCLVIRTAYQGKMFDFITGDIRKQPIANTNHEIFEKNVTILNKYELVHRLSRYTTCMYYRFSITLKITITRTYNLFFTLATATKNWIRKLIILSKWWEDTKSITMKLLQYWWTRTLTNW